MEARSYIEEIKRYLNKNIDKGYKLDDLKIQLKKQGYNASAVSRALQEVEKERNSRRIEVKIEEPKEDVVEFVETPKKSGFFSKVRKLFKS